MSQSEVAERRGVLKAGMKEETIGKILHGNVMRVLAST